MKLIDALRIAGSPVPEQGPRFHVALACGFTPLHLKTYLTAHLRQARPDARLQVSEGVFDDLIGNVERAEANDLDALAVVVEWADIDPRLGVRRLGGWALPDLADTEAAVELNLARLAHALSAAADTKPVVVCLPTLPLPPLFPQRPDESGEIELQLRARLAAAAAALVRHDRIRVCNAQRLDELSPMSARRDLKAELSAGFPYSLTHASAVADTISALACPPTPKKGLITDLDGTLWSGIVGEVGANNVSWSLDDHSHCHALYQQFLASLASAGVMIAIATKNDRDPVDQALARPDVLVCLDSIYPIEVHWGPKSESVRRILDAWNVAADAVVMVDDSRLEIAEVQQEFPELRGLQFPAGDDGRTWELLAELRSLFGKSRSTQEDALRVRSLRTAMEFRASAGEATYTADDFLAQAEGCLEVTVAPEDTTRALELINKTNQFNLNGVRLTDAALERTLKEPDAALIAVSYQDKFGPLGTIAALVARRRDSTLFIDSWVMSCRAFSRRIEHHCVQYLFDHFDIDRIEAAYHPTDRNGPVRDFFTSLLPGQPHDSVSIIRDDFAERAPLLMHRVVDAVSRSTQPSRQKKAA